MSEKENTDWKERYDSLAPAVSRLEAENIRLQNENILMEMKGQQWEAQKAMQEIIIQNSLNKANVVNNESLEEIERLRAEIKELRGE